MSLKPKTIVIEDNLFTKKLLVTSIVKYGYDVIGQFSSAEEAMSFLGANHVDIIVSDIRLAGQLDGVNAAVSLREVFTTPIVLYSASSSPNLINKINELEDIKLVSKMDDLNLLRDAMYEYVRPIA